MSKVMYHVFKKGNENFLYISDYKQLFRISENEFSLLNSSSDNQDILQKYINNVTTADCVKGVKNMFTRYGLFLCVANMCNMRCTYCFAHQGDYGKKQGIMSKEVAYSSIDWYLSIVPENCDAYIIFFGGEPLLAKETIISACNYANEKYPGRRINFHLVTNAVLLDRQFIDFLSENNFGVAVSIDGGKQVQNLQRPLANNGDSFYETTKNLPYLFSKINRVHARGTYCDFSLNLAEIHKDLLALGFQEVNIPPDILHLKDKDTDIKHLLDQLDELYDYITDYIVHNVDFPFGLFVTHIRRLFIPILDESYSCGVGKTTFAVDINGDIFPCHRYSEIGSEKIGDINHKDIIVSLSRFENNRCKKCWNQYTCSHGCNYNDRIICGSENIKNKYWCIYSQKMTELSLALVSKLSEKQLMHIMLLPNPAEEKC